MPALVGLLGGAVLRSPLLDAHLQAAAAGGAGVHAAAPEGPRRPGAVPALLLRRRARLPGHAGPPPAASALLSAARRGDPLQIHGTVLHLQVKVSEHEAARVPEDLRENGPTCRKHEPLGKRSPLPHRAGFWMLINFLSGSSDTQTELESLRFRSGSSSRLD